MLKRGRIIAVLPASAALGLMSLAFVQPSQAATPLGPYVIQNLGAQMAGNVLCVQPDPSDPVPDIQLMQMACGSGSDRWWFVPIGSGNYHVQNAVTGNCLRALSNTDFSPVDTIDCTSISNESWSLQAAPSGGHVELISHVGGGSRCLDIFEGSTNFAPVDIFHCSSNSSNTNEAQVYFVQPNPAPAP